MSLPPPEPWAARQQIVVTGSDDRLLRAARLRHPTVAWWWGRRLEGGSARAVCYCCDAVMATWSQRWPMPLIAVDMVDAHRKAEIHTLRKPA